MKKIFSVHILKYENHSVSSFNTDVVNSLNDEAYYIAILFQCVTIQKFRVTEYITAAEMIPRQEWFPLLPVVLYVGLIIVFRLL